MSHVPAFGRSDVFEEYLFRAKRECDETGPGQSQEDAGGFLMNLLEKERWAMKLWGRECGLRFIEWRKSCNPEDKDSGKWTFKRGMEREPMIFVYPQPDVDLSVCIKSSLRVETPDLTLIKRIQHPPPKYLLLNMSDKVPLSTPLSYFQSLEFSPTIKYGVHGFVIHLGPADGLGGHYVYVSARGLVFNDLDEEVKRIPLMTDLRFTPSVSPSLVLYRRTSRRKNPRVSNLTRNISHD